MKPKKMKLSPRQVFLMDGLGALVTATLLSQVLARFEAFFGMDENVLYRLASIAFFFAVYSLIHYMKPPKNWRRYLGIIACANTIYCLITLGLIVYLFPQLTIWGIAYFLGEIIVIVILVRFEFLMILQGNREALP